MIPLAQKDNIHEGHVHPEQESEGDEGKDEEGEGQRVGDRNLLSLELKKSSGKNMVCLVS